MRNFRVGCNDSPLVAITRHENRTDYHETEDDIRNGRRIVCQLTGHGTYDRADRHAERSSQDAIDDPVLRRGVEPGNIECDDGIHHAFHLALYGIKLLLDDLHQVVGMLLVRFGERSSVGIGQQDAFHFSPHGIKIA
ncbi:hypothetical protein BW685_13725 [Burkholderia ubonensis]|uniref:Uncharacterized protein n=1 Tax=Burkholderia ubonensis TaxID=101571 RepID=A0A1R1JBP8_9BURK|nr:hypothetical protein BW685_13725 [Burkholderia ubonensis]